MKYEIILYWSEEDGAYIAEVPELAGCMADDPLQRTRCITWSRSPKSGSRLPGSWVGKCRSQA